MFLVQCHTFRAKDASTYAIIDGSAVFIERPLDYISITIVQSDTGKYHEFGAYSIITSA